MLWDTLHFVISLVEVAVAIALILIAGVVIAKIAFWILSRSLGKLAGPREKSDPYDDELDDYVALPSPPDDTPSEDRG
jgi:hypothetical protein